MTSRQPQKPSSKPGRKPGRSERLAMALRANLRRRKAQARGREVSSTSVAGSKNDG